MRIPCLAAAMTLALVACGDDTVPEELPTLVRQVTEGRTEGCQAGATIILAGPDRDGDGALDDDEVVERSRVCDPAPTTPAATPTLSRRDAEPAGEHCASGGSAVRSGRDLDGDGALDDAEIEVTTYACAAAEVLEGDVTYAGEQGPDADRVRSARVIIGDLHLGNPDDSSLPALESVTGAVYVMGAGAIELPALRHVGGALRISTPIFTGAVRAPVLVDVGGDLGVSGSDRLTGLSLAALRSIGGSLSVVGPALDQLELPALRTVGRDVSVSVHAETLALPPLTSVGGALRFVDCPRLGALTGLDELTSLGGDLEISRDGALTEVELALRDHDLGGDVTVAANPQLRRLALPHLLDVEGMLSVTDLPVLDDLALPSFGWARRGAELARLPGLKALRLDQLSRLGIAPRSAEFPWSLAIHDTGLLTLELSRLSTASGEIYVYSNPDLARLALPELHTATGLMIDSDKLTFFAAPKVQRLARFYADAPLSRLSLDGLIEASQWFRLRHSQLVDLRGVGSLFWCSVIELSDNGALTSLAGLGQVQTADQLFLLDNALVSLDGLDALRIVTDAVQIIDNRSLTSLRGLGGLAAAGSIDVDGNDALLSLDGLEALNTVTAGLSVSGDALESIKGLSGLAHVGGIGIRAPGVPADQIQELMKRLGR